MYLSRYFNGVGGEGSWYEYPREFRERLVETRDMKKDLIRERVEEAIEREEISSSTAVCFLEESLARFETWINHPTVSTCQIKASRRLHTVRENQRRNRELRHEINKLGYSVQLVKGNYANRGGETYDEWSWFVIGRKMDGIGEKEPGDTPEDVFEGEILALARRFGQATIIVTRPGLKEVLMLDSHGKILKTLPIKRFGADAFHALARMRTAGKDQGGARINGTPHQAWLHARQEFSLLPIRMPTYPRPSSLSRWFRQGVSEDGRNDLIDTVDYLYSRASPDLTDKWWPNTRREDRLILHHMQEEIMDLLQDALGMERRGEKEEGKRLREERNSLLGDWLKIRQMGKRGWGSSPRGVEEIRTLIGHYGERRKIE